jgi:hypothetical protein
MMFRGSLGERIVSMGLCGAAAVLCAAPSKGADKGKRFSPNQCEASWRNAQTRIDTGRLREARELLSECARPACGAIYVRRCVARSAQLDSDIPTVVPVATDEAGAPLVDVQVKADGELVTARLDGRGLAIDPGLHQFSFSTPDDGVFAETKVMILEGQRNRPISVSLHRSGAPVAVASTPRQGAHDGSSAIQTDEATSGGSAPDGAAERSGPAAAPLASSDVTTEAQPKKGGRSALPFVIGGVGLASIGAGALMTYWGNRDNAAMSSCSPNCVPADVLHIRQLYLASDITLAAGAAALGLATVLFFVKGSPRDERPARTAYAVDVGPAPAGAGAFASVKGAF